MSLTPLSDMFEREYKGADELGDTLTDDERLAVKTMFISGGLAMLEYLKTSQSSAHLVAAMMIAGMEADRFFATNPLLKKPDAEPKPLNPKTTKGDGA